METCDNDDLAAEARGIEDLSPRELREMFAKVLDNAIELCGRAEFAIRNKYQAPAELHAYELGQFLRIARREVRP